MISSILLWILLKDCGFYSTQNNDIIGAQSLARIVSDPATIWSQRRSCWQSFFYVSKARQTGSLRKQLTSGTGVPPVGVA
jgi:hypothetical protein